MEFKFNKVQDLLYLGESEQEAYAYIKFPKTSGGSHTVTKVFVSEKYRGQGLAGKMMGYLYNYAKEHNLVLEATCSYAKSWLGNVRQ